MRGFLKIIWMIAFIVVGQYFKTMELNNPMDVMYGVGAFMGFVIGILTMYDAQEGRGK